MATKKTNPLEDFISNAGQGFNNLVGGAVKNTTNFLNSFNQEYNKFNQQNTIKQQQNANNAVKFTRNIVNNGANAAVHGIQDYFQKNNPINQPIAPILNPILGKQNPTVGQGLKFAQEALIQGPAQFGAGIGLTLTGEKSYNPNAPVGNKYLQEGQKFLLGDKLVKDIKGQGEDVSKALQGFGVSQTDANRLGTPAVLGLGLASVLPGGSSKNKALQEGIQLVKKASTLDEFILALTKASPETKKAITTVINSKKNPVNSVEDFYSSVKGVTTPKTPVDILMEKNPSAKIIADAMNKEIGIGNMPGSFKLPNELKGAKPRYGKHTLTFDNDVDLALYTVGNTKNISASDGKYMAFLKGILPSMTDSEIRGLGQGMRAELKQVAGVGGEGNLKVPTSNIKAQIPQVKQQLAFKTIETDWQEVDPGKALPIGGEFKIENGKQYVRFPDDIARKNEKIIQEEAVVGAGTASSKAIDNPTDPFYNVQRIGVSRKVQAAIKETVQSPEVKAAIDRTVGIPLTFKEQKVAAKLSKDLAQNKTREQTKKLGAEALALRNKIADLAEKGLTDEEYHEAIIRDKAFGAFLARLLGQRRINSSSEEKTLYNNIISKLMKEGKDPDELIRAAKGVDFNDQQQVIAFYRAFVKPDIRDWITKIRYNSMLSGITTHLVNIASNITGTGVLTPIRLTTGGLIDKGLSLGASAMGKERPRTRFATEGYDYLKTYFAPEVFKESIKSFKDTISGKNFAQNPDLRFIPITKKGDKLHPLEVVLDSVSKLLEGGDQMFLTPTRAGFETVYKNRQNKGIKLNVKNEAEAAAKRQLFRQDLMDKGEGALSNAIGYGATGVSKLTNAPTKLIRWPAMAMIPFLRIASNLLKAGTEYNPVLGAANLKGNTDKIDAVSKLLIGSVFTGMAASLYASGRLTNGSPKDETERKARASAGILDNSIIIDTPMGRQSIQFRQLHPALAFQLGIMVNALDAAKNSDGADDVLQAAFDTVAATQLYTADQSYLKSVSDLLGVFRGDKTSPSSLSANIVNQGIPFKGLMSYVQRNVDQYQRSPDTDLPLHEQVGQRVMGGIPGLSLNVPEKKGLYDQPLENPNRFANSFLPYKSSTINEQGVQDYEQIMERKKSNKEVKKLQEQATKDKDALDIRTPTEKVDEKRSAVQTDLVRNKLKLEGGSSVSDDAIMYFDDASQEVKTIDLKKFNKKQVGIGAEKQKEEMYKMARDIHDITDPRVTQEERDAMYEKLGTDRAAVRYDSLASNTNEVKTNDILSKLSGQPKDVILERLITGRSLSSSGNVYASDGVIGDLVDEGLITADEGKALKKIKYNKSGELLGSSGSGSKKSLALKVNAPSIKLPGGKSNFGAGLSQSANAVLSASNRLRTTTSKPVKVPRFQPIALPKKSKGVSMSIRPMVKTIRSLGQV